MGQVVLPFSYDRIMATSDEDIFIITKENKQGAINISGKVIVPAAYKQIILTTNNLLKAVEEDEKKFVYYGTDGTRYFE